MHKKLPVIVEAYQRKYYRSVIARCEDLYTRHSSNHWFMVKYAQACNLTGSYKTMQIADATMALAPKCPEAILVISNIYADHKRYDDAYNNIIPIVSNELSNIMESECFDGIGWARSIYNDSRIVLAKCLLAKDDIGAARRYIKIHMNDRVRGRKSMFPTATVKELSKEVERKM